MNIILGLFFSLQLLFTSNSFAHTTSDYLEPILIDPVPMHRGLKRGKCPISTSIFVVQSSNDGLVHVPFLSQDDRAGFHICLASEQRRHSGFTLFGKQPRAGSINEGYFFKIGWGKTNRFFKRKDVVQNMTYGDGAMFTFALVRDENNRAGYDSTMMTFDVGGELLITAINSNGDFISPTYILPPNMPVGGGAYMGRYLISLERFYEDK